jgi:hypothetical protein
MQTLTDFNDEEIYVCNKEEARQLWKDEPDKRSRIYLEGEFKLTLSMDTEKVIEIVEHKRKQPGYTYK